jgi:acyl carrier protein
VNRDEVSKRIDEYAETRGERFDDPLDLVEAALFVEDVFGITLTDDDMSPERLGTIARVKQLVLERMEIA